MALASWPEMSETEHFVQFCETDAFLVSSVSKFISAALIAGDAGIILATQPHRESIEERLRADGPVFEAAREQGRYVALDAATVLSQIMVDGELDVTRFNEIIGGIVRQAAESGCN